MAERIMQSNSYFINRCIGMIFWRKCWRSLFSDATHDPQKVNKKQITKCPICAIKKYGLYSEGAGGQGEVKIGVYETKLK